MDQGVGDVTVKVSFVIPAYNEEALVGETVSRLHDAATDLDLEYEIIVVNDNSDDRTAEVAAEAGARVIDIERRQIAAARNAGATEATGDILIFVDADTVIPRATLDAAMRALAAGAVGGGATIRFNGHIPLIAHISLGILQWPMRWGGMCGGCFMFMKREAFDAVGGFDEQFYASEEIWLARALRQHGRFVILWEAALTSGRKLRIYGTIKLMLTLVKFVLSGSGALTSRDKLDVWYDGSAREPQGADEM